MDKPTLISDHRKEVRCDYCGKKEHDAPFACPRIRSVTYVNNGMGEVESLKIELRDEDYFE